MMVDVLEIIKVLRKLEEEIYGCGNGRVKVNAYIKQLIRDYDIKDSG